jgi:hypothetical protein
MSRYTRWSGESSIAGDKDLRFELLCPMGEGVSIAVKQMEHHHQGKDKVGLDLGTNGREWSWESRASRPLTREHTRPKDLVEIMVAKNG